LRRAGEVRRIIESKQNSRLPPHWSLWKPICERCGKLQTTVLTRVEGLNIEYRCQDYAFEKHVAEGCGFEGKSDLRKANGKLVWKSEWAAQWKRWSVCSEGAGKEYEAKNSAFWVNAEICERVLDFPMPVPIFYEHLMVDGKKMSASLGNVVYPRDWLAVSRPETLKYLYMKRIMKARSFSWGDIPKLELEFDRAILSKDNKLVEYSVTGSGAPTPIPVDYSTIASLAPLFPSGEDLLAKLVETGAVPKKLSAKQKAGLLERIEKARVWVERYAPPESKLSFLLHLSGREKEAMGEGARRLLPTLVSKVSGLNSADEIQRAIFDTAKGGGIEPKKLFRAIYLALTGKDFGPRAGLLILAMGKDKCLKRLQEAAA
jgi:lysyl-tRNA synthetase class 1